MDNPSLIDYLTYKAMMWHFLGVMSNVFNIKKVYIIIDTSETHDPWKKKTNPFHTNFAQMKTIPIKPLMTQKNKDASEILQK